MPSSPCTTSSTGGLVWFLVLAFVPAWGYVLVARLVLGWSVVDPLVQLPFAFAPAVAAVVVRRWVTREGFADAGLRPRWRKAWPHYLIAWWGPLALTVGTLATAAVLGLWAPSTSMVDEGGTPWWVTVVGLQALVLVITPLYWGEEFGWTSYLRLRLVPHRPWASTLLTGLIWAVWHYPLAFLGYVEFSHVLVGLAVWTASFVLQEILLTWLRLRSGTVWTSSLAHAGNNMVLSLLTATTLAADEGGTLDGIAVTALTLLPMGVACAWITLVRPRHGRRGLSG
ncbi:MAG: CPBP family intramembrane metalloprotease [Terrabacter sp.]|nr:CPBP family intramembrane metalloprotease [Terrabacter sp.]